MAQSLKLIFKVKNISQKYLSHSHPARDSGRPLVWRTF